MDALRRSPPFTIGGWAWIYNSAATIRQGAKKGTRATVLKTKLSFNWTDLFKILAVRPAPASAIPDGLPLHDKLLYFDLLSDMPRRDPKHCVSFLRFKPYRNPDGIHDLPKHLPADLTKYVLNSFSTKPHPSKSRSTTSHRRRKFLEFDQITGHQLVRGRGGVIAVYENRCTGRLSPSWQHERDVQHHQRQILRY